jgi:hypothetical protein
MSFDLGAFLGTGSQYFQYDGSGNYNTRADAIKASKGLVGYDADNIGLKTSAGMLGEGGEFNFGGAINNIGGAYGLYDSIWGSGKDKRAMYREGLAAMKDNRRLARQTMSNNMRSYDNNLARQKAGEIQNRRGMPDAPADERKALGEYNPKSRL